MKIRTLRVIACMLLMPPLLAVDRCMAAEEKERVIPPFEQLSAIIILTANDWQLAVAPDGSGTLAYGSSFQDTAGFPAGTIMAREVYKALVPTLHASSKNEQASVVSFLKRGEASAVSFSSSGESEIADIFLKAKSRSNPPDKERFKRLWREKPVNPEKR